MKSSSFKELGSKAKAGRFNFAAKKLFKRLVLLGAKCFYPVAYGNDQDDLGIDATFDPWLLGLLEHLVKSQDGDMALTLSPLVEEPLPPLLGRGLGLELKFGGDSPSGGDSRSGDARFEGMRNNKMALLQDKDERIGWLKLTKNQRITDPGHFQDVRHLEFQGNQTFYQAGDILCVYPENDQKLVQEFLDYLQWHDLADMITLQGKSLRQILTQNLDIFGVPKRSFFELVRHFAKDSREKERLSEFASMSGQVLSLSLPLTFNK